MFHLAAYTAAIANVANTAVQALADQVLQVTSTGFRLVDQSSVVAAAAMSATLTRAKLDSPTLRINGDSYILPPLVAAVPGAEPRSMNLTQYPLPLPIREQIDLLATSGIACGTERFTGLIWVSFGFKPVAPGMTQWVRLTSTTAAVANVWTQAQFAFESSLPSGYWAVTGMRYVAALGQAARLTFPGQLYRPGVMAVVADTGRDAPFAFDGSLGEFGRFVNDNPPLFEVLVNGTTAVHTIYLGLVRVGAL